MNWETRKYSAFPAYGDSKMYLTMFSKAFNFWNFVRAEESPQDPAAKDSELFQKKIVKCVSLHPGCINSGIVGDFGRGLIPGWDYISWIIKPLLYLFMKNEVDGAQTILYTA